MMSYKEFKAVCAAKVAGPRKEAKSENLLLPRTSLTTSPTPINVSSVYPFVIETYRDLHSYISGLHEDIQLIQTINKYKKGCNEVYTKAFESYDSCYQLAQNIVRTMDIFKELCSCLPDLEEYNYRLCEIISIFIACELRLSADAEQEEQLLVAQRIIYIMRRHLVQEEEHETSYNILRTLVYIPKLFNARDIMCAIFGEFIPLKPVAEVNVLPDKLYILYIIVFYRWMMMQKEEDDKILIVNFAESFMKPSVSLCSNKLYGAYLPMYTKHSTATRTILNNLKYYVNIRNASIIDNAFKQAGAIVNLCDDDEDDIIIVDTPSTTEFAQIFSSIHLEPVSGRKSSIKLEKKTVVGTVDLTEDDEPLNPTTSIDERHEKWLNEFQKLAKQYRDSQLILEKHQNIQTITNVEKGSIICLDSDSEEEAEEISAVDDSKKTSSGAANQRNNSEDLFADNYPLTNTPLNCDSDLESLDAEDENDITKISPRFLSSNLRTYQAKKTQLLEMDKNNSGAAQQNLSQDMPKAYRRDSIHISSTPPEETLDEEDESTDVQDENDDENEVQPYTFLPTTSKEREKEIPPKQIRPMGPYPTYNNMQSDKSGFSQAASISSSSSSEAKRTESKQKKMVKFNTNLLGSTASTVPQKLPLKPALQKSKYKASDALEYYHLRGFERLCAPSTADSTSTASSSKQQEPAYEKCNRPSYNIKKFNHNKCSNLYKNLSVFKQKSFNFSKNQNLIKNLKINLKKIKLDKDISLTNLKSNFPIKEEPHTTTLTLIKNIQTESCQLKIRPITNAPNNKDDDIIFKKPLPVTKIPLKGNKKAVACSKFFKMQKVPALRDYPCYLKRRATIREVDMGRFNLLTSEQKMKQTSKLNEKERAPVSATKKSLNEAGEDDLSKISKLLADEINFLICKPAKTMDMKDTNHFDIDNKTKNEDVTQAVLQNDLIIETGKGEAKEEQYEICKNFNEEKSGPQKTEIEKNETDKMTDINISNTSSDYSASTMNDESNSNVLENFKTNHQYLDCQMPVKILESSETNECEENISILNNEHKTLPPNSIEKLTNEKLEANLNINGTICSINTENLLATEDEMEKTINANATQTKDGKNPKITENVASQIENSANENIQKNDKIQESIVETTQQNSAMLVANFSAEYLAGLPTEPSPSTNEVEESECEGQNGIDFEFENNCSTPTMCRIDLDVMSENTSDVPVAMPLTILPKKECEADKLLEDFNNKTEDIVGSALNKNSLTAGTICSSKCNDLKENNEYEKELKAGLKRSNINISHHEEEFNTELLLDNSKEKLKRLRVSDVPGGEEDLSSEPSKKAKKVLSDNERLKLQENIVSVPPTIVCLSEQMSNVSKNMENVESYDTSETNQANKILKTVNEFNDSIISLQNSNIIFSSQEECKETRNALITLEEINQKTKNNSAATTNPITDEILRDVGEKGENRINKNEAQDHQVEGSVNENQHMTVELGNWKQELKDEIKASDPKAEGVSAIFSFPKIPIISISIHTTPNKKTYFKISNRENDNQIKNNVKSKKSKHAQACRDEKTKCEKENEKQPGDDSQKKEIKSPQPQQECKISTEEESSSISLEENTTSSKEEPMKYRAEKYNEDEEEIEEEAEEVDEEVDNFEIEKFSHDSNSACSLPLKKRPTQAEPNGETDVSQTASNANYDQSQEIAAEVVIENTCKEKTLLSDNTFLQLEEVIKQNIQNENVETVKQDREVNKDVQQVTHTTELLNFGTDFDDNRPSTSSACFKNLSDISSPFKRRVHAPLRPIGQTPIQIVAPQLKDNPLTPNQDDRTTDAQIPSASRMTTQIIQPLPESYPATPMLSVANVEKLMDFNRFIEELLASPDVRTIIDNANACGYYAEDQTYELERIAILEHYNIANAKGSTTVTKPLYWKKSAGDTISIFDDNDNEWISLPPSTAKQLQKLSFVLSILQQQYKVTDVRQRINIALTFLIRNTSKYRNTSSSTSSQSRMPPYSRNISDLNGTSNNNSQPLPSPSYFRIATNNDALNTNFCTNIESVNDFHSTNSSNSHQHPEITIQPEPIANNSQNWNNSMHNEQTNSVNSPQRFSSSTIECEQPQHQQQTQTPDRRNNSSDELSTDQLYINPPCASSPQNEVIVNTNGVELHDIPQDPQNIFISITDESLTANANVESSLHKYNTRHQQQQFRTLEDSEGPSSSSSHTQQPYGKRSCLPNNAASFIANPFMRNNVIPTFGNQEINLQNPYRIQQQQNINTNSNFSQRHSSPRSQQHQKSQQRMPTKFSSSFNAQFQVSSAQPNQSKSNDSSYKEILQPYITYLIKDHEKTSKHLLQVFEEVSNSNTSNEPVNTILSQHQQQLNSLLPPLIRNPQQNHMPGFHQITANCDSGLPSLIRNPHQNTLVNRDSGALQVVQSFIDQSQTSFDATQQQREQQVQLQQQLPSSLINPGFAKEYVNFVGAREKLRTFNKKQQEVQQQQQAKQLHEQLVQQQQDTQRLNCAKRRCQERNDKLAEDLKRKMVEFSLLKHNFQVKLLEKQQKQQKVEVNPIENIGIATRRRGRPKKILNKEENDPETTACDENNLSSKDKRQIKCTTRVTRRKQASSDLSTSTSTIDHAYFRQRSAAREAAKRINATVNNSFH